MSGRLIAIVGPSGVGKDSVMSAMIQHKPSLRLARRVITRDKDAGGEDFDSVDPHRFEDMRLNGDFALWWSAHGLSYGIPTRVEDELAEADVLVNLSRGVLGQAQERFANLVVVALDTREDVLKSRLMARGRETHQEIMRRLARPRCVLPSGLNVIELDNSGALDATAQTALMMLYPTKTQA